MTEVPVGEAVQRRLLAVLPAPCLPSAVSVAVRCPGE